VWATILAAASNTSDQAPEVPAELIGGILIALITGATAVAVALIQRNKKDNAAAAAAPQPFVISEQEWIAVRDRSIRTENTLEMLDRLMNGHILQTDAERDKLREDVANIKGQLGIR
jgi:hypothetical protein